MFKNYFKTAVRNLRRNKVYAAINVLGMAVGIAACLLIFLVIQFETSFDNFHANRDQIYRVGTEFHNQDGVSYSEGIAFPAGEGLRLDFPELRKVARIFEDGHNQVTLPPTTSGETRKFFEDIYFAEPDFFQLFNFPMLAGDARTVLSEPYSVIVTQAIAEKYFGDWKSAIGKTLKRNNNNKEIYKINGILKNMPANTDFPLTIVASYESLKHGGMAKNLDDWVSTWSDSYVFVQLPSQLPLSSFNQRLKQFAKKHKPAEYASDSFVAQPLAEIHFDDRFGNFRRHTFSKTLVKALSLIGIFLLIIACVNFINLATAQAVNRAKEVGVRKVLGTNKMQLRAQFLFETAMIILVAMIIGIGIGFLVLPMLNKLLEVQMSLNLVTNPAVLGVLILIGIVVSLLSGFYPAIVLSEFNPITALKSKVSSKMMGGLSLRRVLVVLQFSIAHVLIIGTLIVVSQMNYFRNASLGFDKEAIVNVPLPNDSLSHLKFDHLKDELQQNAGIRNVSFSFATPSSNGNWQSDFKYDHASKSTDFSANLKWADVDYFKTFDLQFVAGRPYYPSDTVREIVVNQTLLKKLGVTDPRQAIGKEINFWDGRKIGHIVGVIRDFNSYSLRDAMAPVLMSPWKDVYQTINIKIQPGKEKQVLSSVEQLWNKAFPNNIYEYTFLDKTIESFYKQENQLSQLYKIFASIAIFISCLGLYGLVSFMAVQRTKEVGIRKVLGASAGRIILLFSKEFTLLIGIAFIIATPIAYYFMHKWLQNFSYRIQLGMGIFLAAILFSIIIAWITVGYRAMRAALANPVKSLRTE
jgi:ABC-type antimicrobial peptide transport system permease subunit